MNKDAIQQNRNNHGRVDFVYHGLLFPVLAVNLLVAILHVWRHPGFGAVWILVLSVAAVVLFAKLRLYPMKVQDRVIRLEERLRLQALAPVQWHAQIYRLTEDQLIGLRFAADDELVELAKLALEQNLDRNQIKDRILNWRPDTFRV